MFEFLMPLLFTRSFSNSLIDHACREAVRVQIEYGREKNVPWGISESAYSETDADLIYQYRAFGVPSIAVRPGQKDELVVAPYATMLALTVEPEKAIENLRTLMEFDAEGPMGFYESIDFQNDRERGCVIRTHMSHHEAMSLLALDGVLHHGVMQERFHSDPRVRAIESLLFERIPIASPPRRQDQAPCEPSAPDAPAVARSRDLYAAHVARDFGSGGRWNRLGPPAGVRTPVTTAAMPPPPG